MLITTIVPHAAFFLQEYTDITDRCGHLNRRAVRLFRPKLQEATDDENELFLLHSRTVFQNITQRRAIVLLSVLVVGFLGSIGFVCVGLWLIYGQINPFVGWPAVIFFGLCAVASGYMLVLKWTMPKTDEVGDSKREA